MDRLSERDPASIRCELIVEMKHHRWSKPSPTPLTAVIVDVSATGAGLLLIGDDPPEEEFRAGRLITLTVGGLDAVVRVRHAHYEPDGFHVGVEFDQISHDLQVKLHDAIADHRGWATDQAEGHWNHAH